MLPQGGERRRQRYGAALTSLAAAARGRFWLRPSDAARFVRASLGLALLHPKVPAVHVGVPTNRLARPDHLLGILGGERVEPVGPAFPPDRQALRHRRALRQARR